MPLSLTGVTVMLAGPSDTAKDIDAVFGAIRNWNEQHARDQKVVFLPVHYMHNVVPVYAAGVDGQAVINEQITNDSDIVVSLFRHRLGTPTPRNTESASVEEIEIGDTNGSAHVWFWNGDIPRDVLTDSARKDERDRLEAFRRKFESAETPQGLYGTFDSNDQLRSLAEKALWHHARRVREETGSARARPEPTAPTPSLKVNLVGPVWHLPDIERVITVAAESNAKVRNLNEGQTQRYLRECLGRAEEIDTQLAANVGAPLAVDVSTDGARITDLQIEICLASTLGVDPEREGWHDVWKTPESQNTLYPNSFLSSYNLSLPIGSMRTWPERSSWALDGDDVIVTVEIDDLRKRRTPTRVDDDVVIALPAGSVSGEGGESIAYTWTASGDVSGRTESWSGRGDLEVIAENAAIERLMSWRSGELWNED